ncbi:MAG: hypothetical protein ACOC1P_02610 [Minisyncoccales bacterium]
MISFSKIKNQYLTSFLIALIFFNVGFYIFQINSFNKNIYETKNYKEKKQQIAATNNQLSSKSFQEESWAAFEEKIKKYNFEKVDSSKYVKVTENSVVRAE